MLNRFSINVIILTMDANNADGDIVRQANSTGNDASLGRQEAVGMLEDLALRNGRSQIEYAILKRMVE